MENLILPDSSKGYLTEIFSTWQNPYFLIDYQEFSINAAHHLKLALTEKVPPTEIINRQEAEKILICFQAPNQRLYHLQNMPTGDLSGVASPRNPQLLIPQKPDFVVEYTTLAVMQTSRYSPIKSKVFYDHQIFHNLCPRIGSESEQSSRGAASFNLHTDETFSEQQSLQQGCIPEMPKSFFLYCLRGTRTAHTFLLDSNYLFNSLEDSQIYEKPVFEFTTGPILDDKKPVVYITSILDKDSDGSIKSVRINLHENRMRGINREAQRALDYLRTQSITCLAQHDVGIPLQAGDFCHVPNFYLHGRSQFTVENETARWLLRMHLTNGA